MAAFETMACPVLGQIGGFRGPRPRRSQTMRVEKARPTDPLRRIADTAGVERKVAQHALVHGFKVWMGQRIGHETRIIPRRV